MKIIYKVLFICTYMLFLESCTQYLSNKIIVEDTETKDKLLLTKIKLQNISNEDYQAITGSSSKKLVCENYQKDRIDVHIVDFTQNIIKAEISISKNNDNHLCESAVITSPIKMECQLVFSAMLGNVIKTNKFLIESKN